MNTMKKLMLPLFLFCSCTYTNQQKAEKAVKLYLDSSLNDPHSYESVKFTKIDTLKSGREEDPEYKHIQSRIDSINDIKYRLDSLSDIDIITSHITVPKLEQMFTDSRRCQHQVDSLVDKQETFNYKGKPIGWFTFHAYRTKNGFGAFMGHRVRFELDSKLNKVTKAEEF